MPTTAEVEARLRRTAQACEPLVDELVGEPPVAVVVPLDRRRRSPRRLVLVAAALLLVIGLAGALAVARDEPSTDIATDGGEPTTTTVDPTPVPVAEGLDVLLPDGTRLDVGLPDPGRWSLAGSQLQVAIDDVAEPVLVDVERATLRQVIEKVGGASETVELSPDTHLLVGDELTLLIVERDGWTVSVTVASAGRPEANLPEPTIDVLAAGLAFTLTEQGPVDITAPGLTVETVSRLIEADGPGSSQLVITRHLIVGREPCVVDPARVDERCVEGFRVAAFGPQATAALPEVTVDVIEDDATAPPDETPTTEAADPPAADLVPLDLALPDGSTARLQVPASPTWRVEESHAWVDLGSPDGDHLVRFARPSAQEWADDAGAELAALTGDGAWLATRGSDRWLLVEREGWTAVLGVAGEGAIDPDAVGQSDEALDDDQVAALGREMSFAVTPDGPTDLTGAGLAVTGVSATVRTDIAGDAGDLVLLQVGHLPEDACASTPNVQNRCFADDRILMTGLGSGGQAALAAMTVTLEG